MSSVNRAGSVPRSRLVTLSLVKISMCSYEDGLADLVTEISFFCNRDENVPV